MSQTHYSLATRIIESISRKDVFPSEVQNLSPYIEMVMPELFALTKVDGNCFCNSARELSLSNQSRLDIVFSNNEISSNKKLHAASKNICIVENQLNAADDHHLKKIVDYVRGVRRACKKVKDLQYYWISESFDFALQNDDMIADYADAIVDSKASFPNATVSFHRIQFSVEKTNGEIYVVFKNVDDSSADIIRVPFKYKEANAALTKEATLNIDASIKYPSVFESLTERFIYNKYVELQVPQDKTVLFLDHVSADDAKSFDVPESYARLIELRNNKIIKSSIESFESFNAMNKKFDYIIQNPPYSGNLHLRFLESGLDHLTSSGQMVIIEPSTWLINVRKNGDAKQFDGIKKRLAGHIKSITIEKLNAEFGIGEYRPLSITAIDMSQKFNTIDFACFGYHQQLPSVYDCNLIGNYDMIWSIFNKVQSGCSLMHDHTTNSKIDRSDIFYLPFSGIMTLHGYNSDVDYVRCANGEFYGMYTTPCLHKNKVEIYSEIGITRNGNPESCVFGTKSELENWKHFILNNKLPLFINMVLTTDRHNNSQKFIPWLVDKQYTDDEINSRFGFSLEEIQLIDFTVKKFERNSPWYKRCLCGPSSVSDNEVVDFIEKISK